jgi:hypothetical protein
VERVDHLVERKAEVLQSPGEPDPLDGGGPVHAIARRRALGHGQHAAALVEPDGVDAHASLLGDLSNLHDRAS